ncbi:MAG: DUF4328 domain-containing protein [Alphaproteobacteria bacterium]|jgi:hypothetical protein|nr:DUF4328 domain-containing protein [Alphaproteobacteria bacterium]
MSNNKEIVVKSYFPKWASFTKTLTYLFIACFFLEVITLISDFMELNVLNQLRDGLFETEEIATQASEASDDRQGIIALFYLPIYFLSLVLFFVYVYRSNHNSRYLGAKDLRQSPAWAVIWAFIPIMNIWKFYQAIKEIWQSSIDPLNWRQVEIPSLLPVWWIVYLVSNSIAMRSFLYSLRQETVENLIISTKLSIATEIIELPLLLMSIILIRKITKAQVESYQKLQLS